MGKKQPKGCCDRMENYFHVSLTIMLTRRKQLKLYQPNGCIDPHQDLPNY